MTLDKIEHIIKQNMTITDPKLMDAVVLVSLDVIDAFVDELIETNTTALDVACSVLRVIKEDSPGTYDYMIDEALKVITEALEVSGVSE